MMMKGKRTFKAVKKYDWSDVFHGGLALARKNDRHFHIRYDGTIKKLAE